MRSSTFRGMAAVVLGCNMEQSVERLKEVGRM